MASWVGVITNAGAALLAEWVQESVLSIDSAEAGTGTYAEATLMGRTALADYKQAASIVSKQSITNGYKVKIQVTAPTVAYTLNQFGLKASVNNGTPVLLAIFQNEDGIAIPSLTDAPDFVYSFYAILPIGNENDMSITIDTSALVSRDTLDEAIADLTTAIRTKLTADGGDARDAVVTFDDSDLDSGITSFQTFLTKIVSGMKIAKFFRDFKAGMAYVLHKGSLINNGTCNTAGEYALDAAYGKVLRDDIDSLNSSLSNKDQIKIYTTQEFGTVGVSTITDSMPDASFCVAGYAMQSPDKPSSYAGTILVYRLNYNHRIILALDYNRGVYLRTKYNGVWTGWRTLFTPI